MLRITNMATMRIFEVTFSNVNVFGIGTNGNVYRNESLNSIILN